MWGDRKVKSESGSSFSKTSTNNCPGATRYTQPTLHSLTVSTGQGVDTGRGHQRGSLSSIWEIGIRLDNPPHDALKTLDLACQALGGLRQQSSHCGIDARWAGNISNRLALFFESTISTWLELTIAAQPVERPSAAMLQPHIPTREPPGPLRIVTSSPVHHVSGVSPQGGGSSAEAHDVNVLSRLHALFHSSNSTTSEDAVQGMARVRSEPVPHGAGLEEMISPLTFEDRKAIKVLVITWNMGDALVSSS